VFGTHHLRVIPTGLTYKTIIIFLFSLPTRLSRYSGSCDPYRSSSSFAMAALQDAAMQELLDD
jgi:hypothetical protein